MRKFYLLAFLFVYSFAASAQINLNSGLVAYYPFLGNANDVSGNGNNATITNATLTTDHYGNANSAYYFDGQTNYIQVPSSATLSPAGAMTIYAYFKPQGFYYGPCHGNAVVDKGFDFNPAHYGIRFDDNLYTNGANCANVNIDSVHQLLYGIRGNASSPLTAYTPYIAKNQWFCVVMVQDLTTLKLYVNGVLKGTVNNPVSGLTTDNSPLLIGKYNSAQYPYWFKGVIDDIRIYNRALNALEVDSLCNLTYTVYTPPVVINKYAAVTGRQPCDNTFSVDTATGFNTGDTVLMIQMKGATVDSSNTASFGNVTALNGAGNYEYNIIKAVSGNNITLKYKVKRQYNIPAGKVQFVRVANFQNYTVNAPHTALPWTGTKGGVFILNATGNVTLNNNISVSGKGFRGGQILNTSAYSCNKTDYFYPSITNFGAQKGEGIAELSLAKMWGRGKLANGGGGGNDHNAGGGGGGNAGIGGLGGNQFQLGSCATTAQIGGVGGDSLTYSNISNKVFLGGGGGAGHGNNFGEKPGAAGGGILFLTANNIVGNGQSLLATGDSAIECTGATPGCQDDGTGGGGGGGAILTIVNNYTSPVIVNVAGGKGANTYVSTGTSQVAPGGGGAGGAIWFSQASVPANTTNTFSGGSNGVLPQFNNNAWGAQPGLNGKILTGLNLSYPTIVDTFKANTITVNFTDSFVYCPTRKLINQTTTTTTGISLWAWDFGDGTTSTQQSPVHTFPGTGTYQVKLIVTDSNLCRDSLTKPVVISCNDTVINHYAAVFTRGVCDNTFGVDSTQGFNVGDTVLMIQMKGATIDSSNTATFGNIIALNGAGNYEYNIIKAISGNNITLQFKVKRLYDIPAGRVQFVRMANFQNYTVNTPHVAMAWTGLKGGVFLANVTNTLTLNSNINVTGKGFRGALANPVTNAVQICNISAYYLGPNVDSGGLKGEGVSTVSLSRLYGRGKLATGGGGGDAHNAGGGGGGNVAAGGIGGYQFSGCNSNPAVNTSGGVGGVALAYSNAANRIFLGGGGGTTQANNGTDASGGDGGGIVILMAGNINGNTNQIIANGADAKGCTNTGAFGMCHDGMGGGGAAGIIQLKTGTISGSLFTNIKGGKGGDESANAAYFEVGPGGGGAGGLLWVNQASVPATITLANSGGLNGVVLYSGSNWGAQPGNPGMTLAGLIVTYPLAVDTFRPNTFNVRFGDSVVSCFSRKMLDSSATTATGIASYSWNAGAAGTSTIKSPVFNFGGYGTYPVKLIVTDSNGCKDSLTKNVVIRYVHFANAGADTTTCVGVATMLHASGGVSYLWSPGATLTTPNAAVTIATPSITTDYIVTVTSSIGCVDMDTATITIVPGAQVVASPHALTNCLGKTVQLNATGVANYQWSPAVGLSNAAISNPIATVQAGSITYLVTGKDGKGCVSFDSVLVTEAPAPIVDAYADGDAVSCYARSIQLHATGAVAYTWHPGAYLNDSTIAAPTATPPRTTIFTVTGTDATGCTGTDTITIISYGQSVVYIPNAFTPNGDHINDDIRPIIFCDFVLDKWEVFNRWGQSVYQGYNLNKGWDGSQNGQPAPMDVYMYYVRGKNDKGETVIYKGNITLIR